MAMHTDIKKSIEQRINTNAAADAHHGKDAIKLV